MTSITLNTWPRLVFFHGSDQEIEAAEKLQDENDARIEALARAITEGRADFAYIDHFTTGRDGRRWNSRHVLHRSAKYGSDLQMTVVTYIDGVFQYMSYDEHISDDHKLRMSFGGPGATVYYE